MRVFALRIGIAAWLMVILAMSAGGSYAAYERESEVRELASELMAPCCFSGTVADHGSAICDDIMAEIGVMLDEDKNREEILAVFEERYGEEILSRPKRSGFGLTAYFAAPLVLLGGGVFLILYLKKRISATKSTEDTLSKGGEHHYDRIEDDLKEFDI